MFIQGLQQFRPDYQVVNDEIPDGCFLSRGLLVYYCSCFPKLGHLIADLNRRREGCFRTYFSRKGYRDQSKVLELIHC